MRQLWKCTLQRLGRKETHPGRIRSTKLESKRMGFMRNLGSVPRRPADRPSMLGQSICLHPRGSSGPWKLHQESSYKSRMCVPERLIYPGYTGAILKGAPGRTMAKCKILQKVSG